MPESNTSLISILLVDNQALLRAGLRLILEKEPEFAVVGEASSREEALEGARLRPDIIILNLNSDGESALDLLPDLSVIAEGARVLVLISDFELEWRLRIVRLGVKGMVQKTEPPERLIAAVKSVYAGEVWLDPRTVSHALDDLLYAGDVKQTNRVLNNGVWLTGRERDIIALIGEGLKNKQIAERLYISEPTVRHYLTSIFEKVGVKGRQRLIVYAYQYGLAKPPAVTGQSPRKAEKNVHKKAEARSKSLLTILPE
ncbi:MAG TPA: response regulator transcription factor [Blastocatellia bacterium]|nr:response regulator transcription factor [Blastocatellia bacterium]